MSLEKREERGRWQWGGAKNCHRVQRITSRTDACKEFFESFLPNIISDTEPHKTAVTKPITQQFWWCRWIDHVPKCPNQPSPELPFHRHPTAMIEWSSSGNLEENCRKGNEGQRLDMRAAWPPSNPQKVMVFFCQGVKCIDVWRGLEVK